MKRRHAILLILAFAQWPLYAHGAGEDGDERILLFRSEIAVRQDASIEVHETIRVRAARRQINHGIFRDFPTRFRSAQGSTFSAPFEVTHVLRDGKPEPWSFKELENGIRVYLGDRDVELVPGVHTYTIAYRTERQLGFFEDHVELHWPVTGNSWVFPIDETETQVLLPPGVTNVRLEAQTGQRGAKGRDATASWSLEGGATFRSTRPFNPGEGLTVLLKWPRGFVREPTSAERAWWFFHGRNPSVIAGLSGLLLILTYFYLARNQASRESGRDEVLPQSEAPAGFSPSAVRFVRNTKWDGRAFTATLIRMAVKGHLVIEEGEHGYTLRQAAAGTEALSAEELLVAGKLGLDKGGQIGIEPENQERIGGAITALKNFTRTRLEKLSLLLNRRYIFPGVALSGLVLVATLTLEPGLQSLYNVLLSLSMFIWTMGTAMLAIQIAYRWQDANALGGRAASRRHAVFIALFSIPFFVGEIAGLALLIWQSSLLYGMTLVGIALLNVLFHYLLKAPTSAGRGLLDQIEAFESYLASPGVDRALKPQPETNPALYEELLPYAVALDLEEQWSRRFAEMFSAGDRSGRKYRPVWYRGDSPGGGWNPATFAVRLDGALSAALAPSASF